MNFILNYFENRLKDNPGNVYICREQYSAELVFLATKFYPVNSGKIIVCTFLPLPVLIRMNCKQIPIKLYVYEMDH